MSCLLHESWIIKQEQSRDILNTQAASLRGGIRKSKARGVWKNGLLQLFNRTRQPLSELLVSHEMLKMGNIVLQHLEANFIYNLWLAIFNAEFGNEVFFCAFFKMDLICCFHKACWLSIHLYCSWNKHTK